MVITDNSCAHHQHRFGDDGVHLPGHDRAARLQVGDVKLCQTRVWPRSHPPDVVANFGQRYRENSKCTRGFDQAITGSLRFEVVLRFRQGQPCRRRKLGNNFLGKAEGGVDPGAGCCSAEGNLGHASDGRLDALDTQANLTRVAGEFLPQGDRGRIHQVGAPRLHDGRPLLCFFFQGAGEVIQSRNQ